MTVYDLDTRLYVRIYAPHFPPTSVYDDGNDTFDYMDAFVTKYPTIFPRYTSPYPSLYIYSTNVNRNTPRLIQQIIQ